jgi:hypothetical protein
MRPKIDGLSNAVRQVLRSHSGAMHWREIADDIKAKGLVSISPEQEEITYGQPNYHHSVRKSLSNLYRMREVDRPSRGMYEWVGPR